MKYLLTESKINDLIKKFALKSFPEVSDVFFTTKSVMLGSTEGRPIIEQTIINVVINNSNNEMTKQQLYKLQKKIVNSIDSMFSLEHSNYESEWDFRIYQLAVCEIDFTLPKVKSNI